MAELAGRAQPSFSPHRLSDSHYDPLFAWLRVFCGTCARRMSHKTPSIFARTGRANNLFCCVENARSAFSTQQNKPGERHRREQAIGMEIRQALTLFGVGGQIARIRKPWVIRSSFVDHDRPWCYVIILSEQVLFCD